MARSTAATTANGAAAGKGRRNNAVTAVAKNKAMSPTVKFVDLKAAAGEKMAVAGAKLGEKMVHLRATVRLGFYRIRHPVHPVRRVAATESTRELKAAATERRKMKEARARDGAMRQRALVRERRAKMLSKSM